MKRPFVASSSYGLTLVELMVGVAILGVLLAFAAPSLTGLIDRRRVIASADEVASLFTYARSEANVLTETVNLHMEPVPSSVGDFSCVRVSVTSNTDQCKCSLAADLVCKVGGGKLLREYLLPRSTGVKFEATGDWIFVPYVVSFQRGSFNPVSNVGVTVTGRTGAKLRVEYSNVGRVRICSPDGNFGGYARCG